MLSYLQVRFTITFNCYGSIAFIWKSIWIFFINSHHFLETKCQFLNLKFQATDVQHDWGRSSWDSSTDSRHGSSQKSDWTFSQRKQSKQLNFDQLFSNKINNLMSYFGRWRKTEKNKKRISLYTSIKDDSFTFLN